MGGTIVDAFGAKRVLNTSEGALTYWSLPVLEQSGVGNISRLPYSIRVLLEAMLRNVDNYIVHEHHVTGLANWNAGKPAQTLYMRAFCGI